MRQKFFLFCVFSFLFSSSAFAGIFDVQSPQPFGPFPVRTQNPLYLEFVGLPLERAITLDAHLFSTSIDVSYSNIFEYRPNGTGIFLDLDMELVRTALQMRFGLTRNVELGIEVPFLSFSGGILDSFLQGYHDAFGFPNGGRQLVDNGSFSYKISKDGSVFYEASSADVNIGDVSLISKVHVFDETKTLPAIAMRAVVKIPTGSKEEGTGSGEPDFGFSFLAEKSYKRLHAYSGLGFVALGGHDDLAPILKRGGVTGNLALEFNLWDSLSLLAQLDLMSSLFRVENVPELSGPVADLTIGFSGARPFKSTASVEKIFYRLGLTEDVTGKGPSVDFSLFFQTGIVY